MNPCSEKVHSLAHLFTQRGFWMATVFQAFVYSLWEKMFNKVKKILALMELNNLEWFLKHLMRRMLQDASITECFYAMHSVSALNPCPLIFIDSIVKQLYQGGTIIIICTPEETSSEVMDILVISTSGKSQNQDSNPGRLTSKCSLLHMGWSSGTWMWEVTKMIAWELSFVQDE